MKKEYCVGVKIINCYYVSAETRDEAIDQVRDMTNDEILLDSDFNIEYADPTNGEIAWKIKATEYDIIDDEHGNVLY
jgi:hypothetical protein